MSQSMLLEIFRMTKLAVIDRQHRAKTRTTQTLELPRLHVWTATSGEQVWNEPKYVFHVRASPYDRDRSQKQAPTIPPRRLPANTSKTV